MRRENKTTQGKGERLIYAGKEERDLSKEGLGRERDVLREGGNKAIEKEMFGGENITHDSSINY